MIHARGVKIKGELIMNYNNYSKPNKSNKQNPTVREPIDKKVPNEEHVEPKFVEGIVTHCIALNIRNNPSMNADVIRVADAGCRVMIDLEHSVDDWYRVVKIFDEEVCGFCMIKFVDIDK